MKTLFATLALLCLASQVAAECANACNGHGTCSDQDECVCYPNYQAADCSERVCPFGRAFVDTPQGDLNHDGAVSGDVRTQWSSIATWELFPTTTYFNAGQDEAHFYMECSNKGLCDRSNGLCQCFEGYTGSSCQRTMCPNDCSGHGVCRTVSEIAAGAMNKRVVNREATNTYYTGVETAISAYDLWDGDKHQACVCDAGFSGHDCSQRECPRGDDPLTVDAEDCGGVDGSCANEVQTFVISCTTGTAEASCSDTGITLSYDSWTGKTWTTPAFTIDASSSEAVNAAAIKAAVDALPNGAVHVSSVAVTEASGYTDSAAAAASTAASATTYFIVTVTFSDPGNLASLSWAFSTGSVLSVAYSEVDVVALSFTCGSTDTCNSVATLTYTDVEGTTDTAATSGALSAQTTAVVEGYLDSMTLIDDADLNAIFVSSAQTTATAYVLWPKATGGSWAVSWAAGGVVYSDETTSTLSTTADGVEGTKEESTCSNRGLCDYDTGICKCFKGYHLDDCSQQNALAL